jgi:hypothetical protein
VRAALSHNEELVEGIVEALQMLNIRRRQAPYHSTDLFGGGVHGRFLDIASPPRQIPFRDVEDQLPAWGQVAAHAGKTLLQVLDHEQVQQRVAWNMVPPPTGMYHPRDILLA